MSAMHVILFFFVAFWEFPTFIVLISHIALCTLSAANMVHANVNTQTVISCNYPLRHEYCL